MNTESRIDAVGGAREKPCLTDPEYQRERLLGQDPALLGAVSALATKIRSCPRDPKFPDIEPTALLVGGFVRDALLGKQPKDADVEVYGLSPERLESLLDQLFGRQVNKVGKAFGILKVQLEGGFDFDVSIPRRESKTGVGHAGFAVHSDPAMTPQEAALRRDFTMNALAADILTGTVIDPYGGLEDVRNNVLRVTDPERFQDDPLRVYRAMQFIGRMGLTVEPESGELMREMVARGQLEELSRERITEEFKKLFLKSEQPSRGFEFLRDVGILERYYPELQALIGVPQEPEWHPEGDVWTHSMMALDVAAALIRDEERGFDESERLEVVVGTLCHDMGKALTTTVEGGRVRSLGHEEAGVEPARAFLGRFTFGERVTLTAEVIAAQHLKPSMHFLAKERREIDDRQYANILRRLMQKIAPVSWRVLVAASEADSRGRAFPDARTKPYDAGRVFAEAVRRSDLETQANTPLIGGKDIIAEAQRLYLVVRPSPVFREIIAAIEGERDEGRLTTREEALACLGRLMKEKFSPDGR